MQKFIDMVERGTKFIPSPIKMFLYLILFVIVLSTALHYGGVMLKDPMTGDAAQAMNMLSKESLQWFLSNMITNYTGYMAFGPVIVMMLTVGICEESGVMEMMMRKATSSVPEKMVPLLICFIGVMSNIADNTSIFVITPLAGFAYLGIGRNPIVGMMTAYLANTSGMAANLLLSNADVLCTGVTNSVLQQMNMDEIPITSNWYFMAVSCIVMTFCCYLITTRILEPALIGSEFGDASIVETKGEITPEENRALRNATIAFVLAILLVVAGVWSGVLTDDTGVQFIWKNLVPVCFFLFLTFGVTYGVCIGNIQKIDDIRTMAVKATTRMAGYMVLVFIMSQFTAILSYSNLTKLLAIAGSDFLIRVKFTGIGLIVVFMLICATVNILMTSQVAKWSIFSPIIVPIFARLGWSPALAQAAFRVSDSATNCMSPISPFLFMMIDIARDTFKCKDTSTSKWLSLLVPSCLVMFLVWTLLLVAWILLDLPLGPGAAIHM